MLTAQLDAVRQRIRQACARAGRDPHSVTLVAVTKTVPAELIRQAMALGLVEFGENRVQEARDKLAALGAQARQHDGHPIRWHLVGRLQRNKARHAVELFDAIHSIDSAELATELERRLANWAGGSRQRHEPRATSGEATLDVFIQVHVTGEPTKSGCRPQDAEALADVVLDCPHLRLKGLMTIPPFSHDPKHARPHFRRLAELRDTPTRAVGQPFGSMKLSMGMSGDFEVAIEEGADVIRIGTALFGERT